MLTICFTGHRPDKLGGYDWNTYKNQAIMKKISEVTENLILQRNAKQFVFGGALGIDQMAFEVVKKHQEHWCHELKMILAVPFKNQSIKWFRQSDLNRYNSQLKWADEVVYVDTVDKYKLSNMQEGVYHPAKMQKRNEFMVDNSDIVVSVWDGTKGGTYNCVKYAQKTNKEILQINPDEIQ